MAHKKRFTVQYRRTREGRTDYRKRLTLLKSSDRRLIVRKFLKNITLQIAEYQPEGDKVVVQADSRELIKLGWKHSRSNLPASYLTGLLVGTKAKKAGITTAILDLGMQSRASKGRIYSAVKGVIDSGVIVPVGEEVLPQEDRILGKHIDSHLKKNVSADTLSFKEKILRGK